MVGKYAKVEHEKRQKFYEAYIERPNLGEAAKVAGIRKGTAHRWLYDLKKARYSKIENGELKQKIANCLLANYEQAMHDYFEGLNETTETEEITEPELSTENDVLFWKVTARKEKVKPGKANAALLAEANKSLDRLIGLFGLLKPEEQAGQVEAQNVLVEVSGEEAKAFLGDGKVTASQLLKALQSAEKPEGKEDDQ